MSAAALQPGPGLRPLLDRRLSVVTGKGGVVERKAVPQALAGQGLQPIGAQAVGKGRSGMTIDEIADYSG